MKSIENIKIGKWEINEEDKKEDLKYVLDRKSDDDNDEDEKDLLEENKSECKCEIINDNPNEEITKSMIDSKRIKKSNFKICTSKCRSEKELIEGVIFKNGWKESFQYLKGDLIWFGTSIKETEIELLKKSKIIFNRYPEFEIISGKKNLGTILNRMSKYFMNDFKFYPKTFIIPTDLSKLKKYMKGKGRKKTYIFKPSPSSHGEGILLFNKFEDIDNAIKLSNSKDIIVQRYIKEPLLLDKKKFDIRIYVLIMGLNPLVGYLCKEGIARFCIDDYDLPDKDNLSHLSSHIPSLNKNNINEADPLNLLEENNASKRTLTSLYKTLAKKGINSEQCISEFKDIIYKSLIALEPFLTHKFHSLISKSKVDYKRCFQVLGFDFLIDKNQKPWLLEINGNPSLKIFHEKINPAGEEYKEISEIDKYVKKIAIEEAIQILRKNLKRDEPLEEHKNYLKAIPSNNIQDDYKFKIFNRAMELFELLAGLNGCVSINSGQFGKIGRIKELNQNVLKLADYDILFSSLTGKCISKLMNIELFFEALEIICNKLYNTSKNCEAFSKLIKTIFGAITLN